MAFIKTTPKNFEMISHKLWSEKWFLLTAGSFEEKNFNSLTVAWGFFGTMWNKPTAVGMVRPTRYSYEFTEKYDSFTLCSFPEDKKHILKEFGTKSGREIDKMNYEGLTAIASEIVDTPSYAEADLIIECKKLFYNDILPENFVDPSLDKMYPAKDYHRCYYGEIVNILKDENFKL